MKRKSRIIVSIVVASVFMLAAIGSASAATYESLAGMKSIKAIFDVRAGNTKSAVMQLKLIHDTYKDKSIRAVSKKPSFIVAFMGPSVKLISKDKQGISPEDQKAMDEIALTVQAMAKDGIKLEVCDFAVKAFGTGSGIDPAGDQARAERLDYPDRLSGKGLFPGACLLMRRAGNGGFSVSRPCHCEKAARPAHDVLIIGRGFARLAGVKDSVSNPDWTSSEKKRQSHRWLCLLFSPLLPLYKRGIEGDFDCGDCG